MSNFKLQKHCIQKGPYKSTSHGCLQFIASKPESLDLEELPSGFLESLNMRANQGEKYGVFSIY